MRPLRLARLLRSLRPLRFLMPGKHSLWKLQAIFLFLEATKAVEVIEVSDGIMSIEVIETTEVLRTTQSLKINNIKARITLF